MGGPKPTGTVGHLTYGGPCKNSLRVSQQLAALSAGGATIRAHLCLAGAKIWGTLCCKPCWVWALLSRALTDSRAPEQGSREQVDSSTFLVPCWVREGAEFQGVLALQGVGGTAAAHSNPGHD